MRGSFIRNAVSVGCTLAVLEAPAQSTVQELLDAGAPRLNHAEVTSLVKGKTMVMPVSLTGADAEVRVRLGEDGDLSGSIHTMFGPAGVSGTWKVLPSGYLCTDLNYTNGVRDRRCQGVYRLGDKYFVAGRGGPKRAEPPPSAQAMRRMFEE